MGRDPTGAISGFVRDGSGAPQMARRGDTRFRRQALKVLPTIAASTRSQSRARTYSVKASARHSCLPARQNRRPRGRKAHGERHPDHALRAIQLVPCEVRRTMTTGSGPCARWPTVHPAGATRRHHRGGAKRESAATRISRHGNLPGRIPRPRVWQSFRYDGGFAVERSLLSSGILRLNGNVGYDSDGQGARRPCSAQPMRAVSTAF